MIDSQLIRWGIVGPGRIASQVIKDFPYVAGADALAVASRSTRPSRGLRQRARSRRARTVRMPEIMSDEDVDAVYIATPHPQHHAIALAAIAAGKAVLVEKTFTATVAGAERDHRGCSASPGLCDGGNVDAFPAGHRRCSGTDRRRRDRRGAAATS